MTQAPIRILGLDPGLRRTGWGVIVVEGARLSHVAHGVIAPKDSLPFAERLLCLFDGIAQVDIDGESFQVRRNESKYIPLGAVHRLGNPGDVSLRVVEVAVGDYLGEDDITRYEDDWER